ncbi:MAG TPA: lipid kinase [Bacteriovoracaceae bacterium]|nr:lipid kinase [Bacteriovoracaceae bacterium]
MDDAKTFSHNLKILLVINPKSRSGQLARDEVVKEVSSAGMILLNKEEHTNDLDPNEIILKYRGDADLVIVGGGDGSVNQILPAMRETQLPLLVLPLGTANNLARTFNLPANIKESLALLQNFKTLLVDLGKVNDVLFVNVAGLGLSTEINRHVSGGLKRYLGVLAFILTAFRLVLRMNPFRAMITVDGREPFRSKSWQISVCNGKYYGAGMAIKHNATLEDQKLHCLTTEVEKWWHGLALIPALMTGRFKKEHDVTLVSGREIKIETRRKFAIDVDGDIKTSTPAVFTVIPKALNLIIPKDA